MAKKSYGSNWKKYLLWYLLIGALVYALIYYLVLYKQAANPYKMMPYHTPTPSATCTPRPACLDSKPRCMIPETEDMCPPKTTPKEEGVVCAQDAKQCPDGSYVGRTGPHCEFASCPATSNKTSY